MAVFVTTDEGSGIDRYSQEIGKRMGVPTVPSRRYLSLQDSVDLLRSLQGSTGVIHFPSQHFGRFGLLLATPFVITVHDLARMCFPFSAETREEQLGLSLDILGIQRAEHLIAVSECTKADLMRFLDVPEGKISVIHNGIEPNVFRPVEGSPFEFPYVLYVGTERPRKNLRTLLEALAALKNGAGAPATEGLKLVKVGTAGRTEEFRRATLAEAERLGLTEDVVFTGDASDQQLAAYYSGAAALIMPSLHEGFGLPLLEAMSCGCPVIASRGSALPEVAGDAALFFDPRDAAALAGHMRRLLTDASLGEEMTRRGFARAHLFSWERAAEETLRVYRNIENGHRIEPALADTCCCAGGPASP